MINEEIVHVNGQPQKLVVFLHGYIDSAPPWIGVCSRCWTIFPILPFIFPRHRKFAKSWITNANGTQCTVLTPMMPENLYRQWKNALKFITGWDWGWPKPFPI